MRIHRIRNYSEKQALEPAISRKNTVIGKLLKAKHGLTLEIKNSWGPVVKRTPIFTNLFAGDPQGTQVYDGT